MTARSAKTALQNATAGLDRSTMPKLPPAPGFQGHAEYMKQVSVWKKWLDFEKDDPLVLERDQPQELNKRILYVYKQATMALRFWPDIWFEAAEWCLDNGLEDEGDKMIAQGASANPESCLLAFKQSDRIEMTTTNDESEESVKRRGEVVRAPYDRVLDALYQLIDKIKERENREIAQARETFGRQNALLSLTQEREGGIADDEDDPQDNQAKTELESRINTLTEEFAAQVELYRRLVSAIWISLMRVMRRIQGKGKPGETIGGFRQIFAEARKRGKVTSEVYTASALIEHHCYKDPAATKIFDRGFKLFPEDEGFATEYIKHLFDINDVTNARAVFETAVNKMINRPETKNKAKPIFALFHSHEALYGEHDQIKKLEKRIKTHFPEDPTLALFAKRHTIPGFDPCAIRPIISPAAQTRSKEGHADSAGIKLSSSDEISPYTARLAAGSIGNSPKRPLDDSDSDLPPRKVQRGESPLKGAAGRRLDAARKTGLRGEGNAPSGTPQPAPAASLPAGVLDLLRRIPPANTYTATRFDASKMVQLLRNIDYSKADLNSAERMTASQAQFAPQPHPGVSQAFYNNMNGKLR